jgi:transcriptional regulator of nitric oxide reductase
MRLTSKIGKVSELDAIDLMYLQHNVAIGDVTEAFRDASDRTASSRERDEASFVAIMAARELDPSISAAISFGRAI